MADERTNDYRPTRREIAGEMIRSAGRPFRQVGDFLLGAASASAATQAIPYCIPFISKRRDDYFNIVDKIEMLRDSNSFDNGIFFGTMVGIVGIAAQGVGYILAAREGYPEVLGIPVAANLASGLYVLYANSRDRLIEKNKNEEAIRTAQVQVDKKLDALFESPHFREENDPWGDV